MPIPRTMTDDQVRYIRNVLYKPCPTCGRRMSSLIIARKYGVSKVTILNMLRGLTYKDVK